MSSVPHDLGPWLAAARDGSNDALGHALESCRRYLLYVAHHQLDAKLLAKGSQSDIVQDTFLEAHRDFDHFQGTSAQELKAWLRSLLVHRVAKLTRRFRKTQKRMLHREVSLSIHNSAGDGQFGLPDRAISPSGLIVANEQRQSLLASLNRLPRDYQQVIRLRYQEGRTFAEIAQHMQRTSMAVRMLWLRAVERLRQELHRDER